MYMPRPLWNVQSHCEKQVNAALKSRPGPDETPRPLRPLSREFMHLFYASNNLTYLSRQLKFKIGFFKHGMFPEVFY